MKPHTAQTILITGASGSTGNALAKAYAAPGTTLILHGRNESKLEQTAHACRAQGAHVVKRVFDITDTNTLQNWVQDIYSLHPLDVLIANQGTFPFFVSFETWLLAVLPASWSLKILRLAGYHV